MAIPEWLGKLRNKIGHDLVMIPTVAGIVQNDEGAVLLQLRSDDGRWVFPGGAIDPGESPATGTVRELYEETGLLVAPRRLVGVYGGSDYFLVYPNKDEVSIVNITFACDVIGGELQVDGDESADLQYFMPDALPEKFDPRHRAKLEHFLTLNLPYFEESTFTDWRPRGGT